MEELIKAFSIIMNKEISVVTMAGDISSADGDIGISFGEAKKYIYTNYKGYNIYPIENESVQAYLLVHDGLYQYNAEIKIMLEAVKDKLGRTSEGANIINEIIEGRHIYLDSRSLQKLKKELPLNIGIIEGYGIYEDEIKEIFKMTMDCSFIVPYNGKLVTGFRQVSDDLKNDCRNFVQNAVGDLLTQCTFSVGGEAADISDIKTKYTESIKALDIKLSYGIKEEVIFFEEMYEYLIADGLDGEVKNFLIDEIFTKDMKKFLNNDMMVTVEEFFKNNLNITETANKLYIHRNTLIYRLDKIYKICGFDLRQFSHSAVFELAYIAWKERLYEAKR